MAITVSGIVRDSARNQALEGALVRLITTEDPVGATVTTGGDGRFVLSGMSLPTRPRTLQATRPGYFPRTLQNPANELSVTIGMTPEPLTDFNGEFLLTLVADQACADLPSHVRSRSYQASLTQEIASYIFRARLSGASFFRNSTFGVVVRPDVTTIGVVDDNDFDDVDSLVENLDPGAFDFRGITSTPTVPGNRTIDAPFDGHLGYCAGTPTGPALTCGDGYVFCDSKSHRLILTPR